MDTAQILSTLRAERDRLDQAIAALEALGGSTPSSTKPGRKPTTANVPSVKKRTMSAAGRKRIAEAQKARWAAKKAAEKKPAAKAPAVKTAAKKTAGKTSKKRVVSAESRKKMAAALQKGWAAKRRAVKAAAKKAAPVAATAKETAKG